MPFLQRAGRAVSGTFFGVLLSVFYLIFGAVLCAAIISAGTAFQVWAHARADDRTGADTIFVLGAAQYDGVPSKWFQSRLDHAAELYRQGVAPTIVTVGGNQPGDRFTEAASGREYLVEHQGVPPQAIVAIERGSDTLTSAQAFKEEAQPRGWVSSVVVTDSNHSLRALRMVEDEGFDAWSSPTRTGPSYGTRTEQVQSIVRETGGLLYYEVWERRADGPAKGWGHA
ncbi:YdcF family protein [Corynebacterium sp. 320]|uniref:YdcF family protein n=1 Tax=Corynebacterium TaxID=1716 RepID=UPI00125CBED4|nr:MULTISPECIES: YdcF family protein [Corynebacterium]KAB1502426.1 YdcF family protein [Corynebacterium sp. 320]KAB1551353.1 YdcF family protein [Corynebacterium sp. 321]KAB1551818.1 YdcF family protein [Corynebacterium sp. 319]KAB3526033.1 YdcF family protein [Corynebacterium sp. 250]KAB3538813.1 YdcF family protein [Corynebacterium sp. 366]